ncbi:MAG: hypothetical protein QOI57_3148 [Rubrobacteraceae bacterium]|nr:hypothetical protein [Rubrobacteraceae bacterium]
MLTDVMHSVSSHRGDEYGQRPLDLPFVQEEEVANSACEWGTACNAGAGMGRVVPDLYSVGRYLRATGLQDRKTLRVKGCAGWHMSDGGQSLHNPQDSGRGTAE